MQSEYEKKTSPSECHVRMTCLSVFLSFLFLLLNSLNSFDLWVYVSDFWNNFKGLKWSPFLRGFCGWRWCSIQTVCLFENVRIKVIKVFIKVFLTALQVDGVCLPRHLQTEFRPTLPALRLSTCTTCSANAMNIVVQLPQEHDPWLHDCIASTSICRANTVGNTSSESSNLNVLTNSKHPAADENHVLESNIRYSLSMKYDVYCIHRWVLQTLSRKTWF